MQQRWTYRCYPTSEQEQILPQTFGCVRYVYNWALSVRTKAFKDGQRMGYNESSSALTLLKKQPETIWLNSVHSVTLQQALRDLQSAFSNFFSKRVKYPTFKKKGSRASARYATNAFSLTDSNRLEIGKLGVLKVRWHRMLPSAPTSVTVVREATGKYYVSFVVEVQVVAMPMTGASVGIDFGFRRLATLSTGEMIANPKYGRKRAKRLAFLQRKLARKQKGSKRRELAKRSVARCHDKISSARKDALNKLTTRLVKEVDVICIEDLNLRGMVKNHNLARSLSDAGIGIAVRMLEEKAERYGKCVTRIDRWFPSSKMCSTCGHINSAVVLGVEKWTCQKCNSEHDRDINASLNILAVGHTVLVHGFSVRDASPSGAAPN